jgi:hypothetical protein
MLSLMLEIGKRRAVWRSVRGQEQREGSLFWETFWFWELLVEVLVQDRKNIKSARIRAVSFI